MAGSILMDDTHWALVVICFGYLLTHGCDAGCPYSLKNFADNSEDDVSERQSDPNAVSCQPLASPPLSCNASSPYRTIDGTCNNLKNPLWGAVGTPVKRLMSNKYADGKGKPFQGVDGKGLPNTRSVSLAVYHNKSTCLDHSINNFIWAWAEMVAGDLVDSAIPARTFKCPANANPDVCISIPIPPEDSFYKQFGVTELNLARLTPQCYNGVFDGTKERVPVNRATHYIDCSNMYGVTAAAQNSVRTFKDGKVKMDPNFPNLLPIIQGSVGPVFLLADSRMNADVQLGLLASIGLDLHNRLCDLLHGVNPAWDDNRLFQEAKRITTALFQGILYGEFLPLLLGPERMRELDLQLPSCRSQFTTYKPEVEATAYAEIVYAALRLHSGLQDTLDVFGRSPALLKNNFLTPQLLVSEKDAPERLTKGLLNQCGGKCDRFFTEALTQYALQPPGGNHGFDLTAVDMRRAEDAGIPTYLGFRSFLGLEVPKDFREVNKIWNDADGTRLVEQVYKGKLGNVPAFLGMMMEPPVPNGATGETAGKLIGRQFKVLKEGDRFYATHGGQAGSFTMCQLKAIRSTLLSDILCLALPGVQQIPKKAFQSQPPFVDCGTVKFDISPWKEQQGRFNEVCTAGC